MKEFVVIPTASERMKLSYIKMLMVPNKDCHSNGKRNLESTQAWWKAQSEKNREDLTFLLQAGAGSNDPQKKGGVWSTGLPRYMIQMSHFQQQKKSRGLQINRKAWLVKGKNKPKRSPRKTSW